MPFRSVVEHGRRLLRRPGFLLLSAAVLGLGLGASLTVLEVADALFWRPLPYQDESRLVTVWQADTRGTRLTVTGADYLSWKAEAPAFQSLAAVSARGFNLTTDGEPERLDGALVSADFFAVLGTRPFLGHTFESGAPGPREVVLGEALWRRRFGGDTSVIGRTLVLDGEPMTVIGVVPAAVRVPSTAQLWVSARTRVPEHPTYPIDPDTDRSRHFLTVIARLAPGQTPASAKASLAPLQARLAREFPDEERDMAGVIVIPLREQLFGAARPQVLVLLAVSALLACVAWANAAHLFLTRRAARNHEVAVRTALGATRRSLWNLFLGDALVIAGLAGLLALAVAIWAAPLLVSASPQAAGLPLPAPSFRLLLLAVGLVLACALSLGVLSALQPVHTAEQIQEGGRTGTESRRSRHLRSAFLAFQVALSVVLLLGTGLLLRSYRALHAVDPGFVPGGVLAVDLPLSRTRQPTPASQARFVLEVLRHLAEDPQVSAAGFVSRLPLSPSNTIGDLALPGHEDEGFPVDLRLASPGYFEALRVPLRAGRLFERRDMEGGPPAAIINEEAARRAFGTKSALGQRILIWGEKEPSEVVGIVGQHPAHRARCPAPARGLAAHRCHRLGEPLAGPPGAGLCGGARTLGPLGGSRRRPGAAAGPAPADGGPGGVVAGRPSLHPRDPDRRRAGGPAPGPGRHLRGDGLLGGAAHARAGRAPRARRHAQDTGLDGDEGDGAGGRRRVRPWTRRRRSAVEHRLRLALRGWAARPDHLRHLARPRHGRRRPGLLRRRGTGRLRLASPRPCARSRPAGPRNVRTLPVLPDGRPGCGSAHAFADVDQELIRGVDPDEPDPWVFQIEDHVDGRGQDEREGEWVKSTVSCATAGHSIAGQHGSDQGQPEQREIDEGGRMRLARHRAGGGDVEHRIERREDEGIRSPTWLVGSGLRGVPDFALERGGSRTRLTDSGFVGNGSEDGEARVDVSAEALTQRRLACLRGARRSGGRRCGWHWPPRRSVSAASRSARRLRRRRRR